MEELRASVGTQQDSSGRGRGNSVLLVEYLSIPTLRHSSSRRVRSEKGSFGAHPAEDAENPAERQSYPKSHPWFLVLPSANPLLAHKTNSQNASSRFHWNRASCHSSFGFGPTVGIPCKRALLRSRTSVLWINLKARFLGFIEHRALYLAWARASFGHLGARGERPPRLDRSSAGPGTPRAGEHGAASSEAVPRGELRAARQSPTQPPPRPLLLFVACLAFWPSLSDRIPAVRQ